MDDSGIQSTFSVLRAALKFMDMYTAANPGRESVLLSTLRHEDRAVALALVKARKWESLSDDAKKLSAQLMKTWSDIDTTVGGVITSVGLRGENGAVDFGEKVGILEDYVQACDNGKRSNLDELLKMLMSDLGGEAQSVSLLVRAQDECSRNEKAFALEERLLKIWIDDGATPEHVLHLLKMDGTAEKN